MVPGFLGLRPAQSRRSVAAFPEILVPPPCLDAASATCCRSTCCFGAVRSGQRTSPSGRKYLFVDGSSGRSIDSNRLPHLQRPLHLMERSQSRPIDAKPMTAWWCTACKGVSGRKTTTAAYRLLRFFVTFQYMAEASVYPDTVSNRLPNPPSPLMVSTKRSVARVAAT